MRILTFDLDGQYISQKIPQKVIADSENYIKLQFRPISTEWQDGIKNALLRFENKTYTKLLDSENSCVFEQNLLGTSGTLSVAVSLVRTMDDGTALKLYTNAVIVSVGASGKLEGNDAPYTPDLLEQVMGYLEDVSRGGYTKKEADEKFVSKKEKGQPSGVAELGTDSKIIAKQIPENITGHINNKQNPHGVTASQIGAIPRVNGVQGQLLGFTSNNTIGAVNATKSGGKRTARLTIGTSTAGWTQTDCDYLCDGTADDVEINAAIQALPATGGEIVILDGSYNITAEILINKENVKIRGNGQATVLNRKWDERNTGVITIRKSYVIISDLKINGNKTQFPYCDGIRSRENEFIKIINNTFYNNKIGIDASGSTNSIITGNNCNNNTNYGITVANANNSIVIGNSCNKNTNYGIDASGSTNSIITGNNCNNNNIGIYAGNIKNSTITGNNCIRGTGQSSDYNTSQFTIQVVNATKCTIIGNNCAGKAPVISGTGNIVANNVE